MKFPCEVALWHVIPAIRARTAKVLKEKGLTQKEIAKILGVSEATVSHYFKNKRGTEFKLDDRFDKKIKKAVDSNLMEGMCCICRDIRKKGMACGACSEESCNVCIK